MESVFKSYTPDFLIFVSESFLTQSKMRYFVTKNKTCYLFVHRVEISSIEDTTFSQLLLSQVMILLFEARFSP